MADFHIQTQDGREYTIQGAADDADPMALVESLGGEAGGGAAPEKPAPTFMGEMAKEGERQIESVKSIGRHLAAPFTEESTGSFSGDVAEGVKHGASAAWEALGLVSPGAIPDAALTAAGHPTAGKVAHVATDVATPFLAGKGRALKTAAEGAEALKGAVGGAEATASAASRAGYAARDTAADAAGLKLPGDHPAIEALKQEASETLRKHGSKAKEWMDRILNLGEEEAPPRPAGNIVTPGGQPAIPAAPGAKVKIDVPHSDLRDIESGLTEAARTDKWLGRVRDEVRKTRELMEQQAPDVAKQSEQLASDYPKVAKLQRLKRDIVNPGSAPSTERTAEEAMSAVMSGKKAPARLRQALDTMDPGTAKAFKTLLHRVHLASAIAGGTGGAAANTLLAIEGGRLVYQGYRGKVDLGEAAGAVTALALRNPKVAMVVARALTTPRTAVAGALLAKRLDEQFGLTE